MPDRPAPMMRTSKCSVAIAFSVQAGLQSACNTVIRGLDPRIHPFLEMGCRALARQRRSGASIPVVIRLERAVLLDADIVGLVLAELGELHADLGEMQACHL